MRAYLQRLEEALEEAHERIARLEQRADTMHRPAPVHERDHEKGVRLKLGGTDDEPFLSPWIQPGDLTGVSRFLPDIGQQFYMLALGGDWSQATLVPYTHSDDKPNPSPDIDTTTFYKRNDVTMSEKKGVLTRNAKGIAEQIDGDTKHSAKNIEFNVSGGGHLA